MNNILWFKIKYRFWGLVHNCISHPLMGITFNAKFSERFHDWTSSKMDKYLWGESEAS